MATLLPFVVCGALHAAAPDWREFWFPESFQRWTAKSERELTAEANQGRAEAMWALSIKLAGEERYAESNDWANKAYAAGQPQALLAKARLQGERTDEERLKALQQAVAAGFPDAKVAMARMLFRPGQNELRLTLPADPVRAVQLLQEAMDERSTYGYYWLAQAYAAGYGEPRNAEERPARLLLRAANNGHDEAAALLAQRFRAGLGIDKDLLQAAAWAEKVRMRKQHFSGRPVPPTHWLEETLDRDNLELRALSELFAKSFEGSAAETAEELGDLHARGVNGAVNNPRAIAFYRLAERRGSVTARKKAVELERTLNEKDRASLKEDTEWVTSQ